MKGLKEFLLFLNENQEVMSETEKVQRDSEKVVEIAKQHGFEFTENEYEALIFGAVAGGGFKEAGKAFLKLLVGAVVGGGTGAVGGPVGMLLGGIYGVASAGCDVLENGV